MVGASVRLVTVEAVAREFGVLPSDILILTSRLGLPVLGVGLKDLINIHALETALNLDTDPATFTPDMTPAEITRATAAVATLYAGARRAAILARLRLIGKSLFPGIGQRKKYRQQHRRQKARRKSK